MQTSKRVAWYARVCGGEKEDRLKPVEGSIGERIGTAIIHLAYLVILIWEVQSSSIAIRSGGLD